ncbi:DUF6169 family protein [Pedobacter sp. N23S346]|uniref:DUF6169 family protein n=1 Tax=Pedobacter sp. N23S346 TaxID=3402750 RepID=UPI003AC81D04
MSARYEINRNEDGTSYQFITFSGNTYIAYFTEFSLQDKDGNEIPTVSFGFYCKLANDEKPQRFDAKIKRTIIYIINEFFRIQPAEAILYLCMNQGGKAKNRHITFDRWFKEAGEDLEKHDAVDELTEPSFYSSIIIKSTNPEKQKFIDAFYYTIGFWGLG